MVSSDPSSNQEGALRQSASMHLERRTDVALAAVVKRGFDLHFVQGYRVTGEFLRMYGVPPKVVGRVINYGARRTSDGEQ